MQTFFETFWSLYTTAMLLFFVWTLGRIIRGYWRAHNDVRQNMAGTELLEIDAMLLYHQAILAILAMGTALRFIRFPLEDFPVGVPELMGSVILVLVWRMARIDVHVHEYIVAPRLRNYRASLKNRPW